MRAQPHAGQQPGRRVTALQDTFGDDVLAQRGDVATMARLVAQALETFQSELLIGTADDHGDRVRLATNGLVARAQRPDLGIESADREGTMDADPLVDECGRLGLEIDPASRGRALTANG